MDHTKKTGREGERAERKGDTGIATGAFFRLSNSRTIVCPGIALSVSRCLSDYAGGYAPVRSVANAQHRRRQRLQCTVTLELECRHVRSGSLPIGSLQTDLATLNETLWNCQREWLMPMPLDMSKLISFWTRPTSGRF